MLGFPNREVKKALFELVLPIMLKKDKDNRGLKDWNEV